MKTHKCAAFVKPTVIALICIMLIAAAALTGCQLSSIASKYNAPSPTQHESDGQTILNKEAENNTSELQETPPIAPQVVPYNVITGLQTTSELADLRPVAVCIENSAYSLPQYGLNDAQVLIEVPLENGGTRLMMLTTDYRQVTTIGSVASTRSYLLELGEAFDAIQCFNGSDDTVKPEDLASYDILDHMSNTPVGIYYSDPTRFRAEDLMTNGILLDSAVRRNELKETLAADAAVPYKFVAVGSTLKPSEAEAKTLSIRYSNDLNVIFTYDSTAKKYVRNQFGTAHLDANTGDQVSFDNLVVLCASSVTYETEESKSLDLVIEDGGSGYYMSNGAYERIAWARNENGDITFYNAQGTILEINRGTTYIGVVAAGAKDSIVIR